MHVLVGVTHAIQVSHRRTIRPGKHANGINRCTSVLNALAGTDSSVGNVGFKAALARWFSVSKHNDHLFTAIILYFIDNTLGKLHAIVCLGCTCRA